MQSGVFFVDWLQSPVLNIFLTILFNNQLKSNKKYYHEYKGWSLVTSLCSHDIILVLLYWIIKQYYTTKYIVTGDWSQFRVFFSAHVLRRQFFIGRGPDCKIVNLNYCQGKFSFQKLGLTFHANYLLKVYMKCPAYFPRKIKTKRFQSDVCWNIRPAL